MRVGSECPNKIIYAKANAASNILLSCATSYDCFSMKTMTKYNKNPKKLNVKDDSWHRAFYK